MKLIIKCLLALVCATTYTQNTINGKIIDSETQEPIAFANVYFPQLEKGTISNENGEFTITNLPTGDYKLVCSYLGYLSTSINITLPIDSSVEISLSPSVVEMEEIIVSTPFHKLQSENVMKVEQQRVSNLKQQGAVTLAEGITSIPGVEAVTTGQGIGKPVIRGLSANRVLVYTQGVRLENQQFGDEHGLGINEAGIESVEVIKGPASLLYGSDALGGVLYLNPEKFANQNTSQGNINANYFTNTNGLSTSAGYKSSGEKFKFLFRGNASSYADYKTEDYNVTNSRFKEIDFKTGIGYQVAHFKTELRYNLNAAELGIPEEIGIQNRNRTPLLPYQDITNHVLSSKSTFFFKNSSIDANFGLIYNDRKEFEEHHEHEDEDHEDEDEHEEEHEIEEPALHMKLKTFNYDIKYNLPRLGKFETIVGVQGLFQENSNYGEEILIPDATKTDFGALATSHIHLDKLDIQLGARFDMRTIKTDEINNTYQSFNAALGGKFNINKSTIVRLNFATGFRAPNLAELASDGTHEGTNRYEIGNANLENERNFQTDLAIEYKSEHVEVFVNGFYNKVANYIYLLPNGQFIEDDPVFLYTQNDANLYGAEIGVHFHPHPLDWLHIESSFETVTGKQDDEYLPLIPANNLNNTLRVEFNSEKLKRLYAFVKLQSTFEQNNVSGFETPTDSYNLLSSGFGTTFMLGGNELAIHIAGTNLTNKNYINHLSRLKPDGIFNMGRNFSIGINYTL